MWWLISARKWTSARMARIRTIKPEFPQSETTGRLSRDARLLFVQLWTIVDDEGRARAASRMLASLLYPYDDDAPGLIDGWLTELERENCIRRYEIDGDRYLEIVKWLKHQKIDRPSKSRLPEYREPSVKPREESRALDADLGPRTVDQGPNAACAASEKSPEAEFYSEGKKILKTNSGGLLKNLLTAKDGNVALARAALLTASTKQDPREYIGAIVRGRDKPDSARDRGDAW
jgi:hypothetical protein